jgi:hypothetical protein
MKMQIESILRIFGPKRQEVTGGCRKLHNDESHNLDSSPNVINVIKCRKMRWTLHVTGNEEMRNACKNLVGKPEKRRPLLRTRRRR